MQKKTTLKPIRISFILHLFIVIFKLAITGKWKLAVGVVVDVQLIECCTVGANSKSDGRKEIAVISD